MGNYQIIKLILIHISERRSKKIWFDHLPKKNRRRKKVKKSQERRADLGKMRVTQHVNRLFSFSFWQPKSILFCISPSESERSSWSPFSLANQLFFWADQTASFLFLSFLQISLDWLFCPCGFLLSGCELSPKVSLIFIQE